MVCEVLRITAYPHKVGTRELSPRRLKPDTERKRQ